MKRAMKNYLGANKGINIMKLYDHQIKALEETKDLNRVAYYHDMGLGKTFTGAEKMKELNANVNLVICQKSKINDWVDHFDLHYRCHVFNLTNEKDFVIFKEHCIDKEFNGEFPCIGVINYELAWRRPKLTELKNFTLMLDESSLIQNETAKRSKFILKLKPTNVILLSGTPTGGKYEKLWSQLHLLGWDISKRMYWNQYVNIEYLDMMGKSIPVVKGYKNVNRLKRKMNRYGCQFLKAEEVIDLPEQIFTKVKTDANKEYKEFMKNSIVKVNDVELVGDTTLTKMLYARELCSIYNSKRAEAFKDLVESTEDNLVVFYNFNGELEQIKNVCKSLDRPYSVVNGAVNDLANNYSVNYELGNSYIIICQYQAGAYGLNLQYANRLIFYSLPLSSELFEQAKKRIHRIGQKRTCFYYILLCKNSIEEKILATLEKRQDYTAALFEKG